ncbi:MAG: hypothetical protein K8T89_15005 [Planctomycetes bacterium]|nr:hypothetical protein [Planctomycetota bacterium]
MNRIIIAMFALLVFAMDASPAYAQRYRAVAPTYRPAPVTSKPYDSNITSNYSSSGSSYSSGSYAYSSGSSSYSTSDSSDSSSGFNFRLICMVIILISIVVRILCGIFSFLAWVGRGITG